MGGLDDKIEFDYRSYRWEAVKYFLDCMHMIKPDPNDMTVILEVLDLAHSEGKTTYDSFERHLSQVSASFSVAIVLSCRTLI